MKLKHLILLSILGTLFYACDKEDTIPETVITFEAQTFEVLETITHEDEIGQVVASSNMSSEITFSIIENLNEIFTITAEGIVALDVGKRIDASSPLLYQIVVQATDGSKTVSNTITINVIDVPDPFVTTWKTDMNGASADDHQITITTSGDLAYDYTIDWGDGNEDTNVTGNITHTYATPGTYTVSILGTFPRFLSGAATTNARKLLSVEQWGDIQWLHFSGAFFHARNLNINTDEAPDLSQVQSLSRTFGNALSLTDEDFSNWDVSGITDMSEMFEGAESFNGDISTWDVSNVTTFNQMFSDNSSFNSDISNWDVSSVTDFGQMFENTASFNQDISNWDVSNATNFGELFSNALSFDQDLGSWDVSSATNMSSMFEGAESFNADLSNWNVSQVTNMSYMFLDSSFSSDISNWDISEVTDMTDILEDANFTITNYNALLSAWSQLTPKSGVSFSVGNVRYSASAQSARNILTNTYNWTITDGGVR